MSNLSDAELLGRLVAFDTTSRNSNAAMAEAICDYLDRPGIRLERNPAARGDKLNLVVTVGPETDATSRQGLVLSGHMDVVPAEEPEWQSDPFELLETDTSYIARGACDMKGFVALAVNAAARADPRRLRRPLALILTYDEEVGTLGARRFAESWPQDRPLPRRAIIGEPTSLEAVRMHKGHTSIRVTLNGRGAHSGYPHLGQSAIEPAGRVICALSRLRRELEAEPGPNSEHFGEVPFVALNVARVHGGTAINVIPERCEIDIGFRILPGMDAAPLTERVRSAIAEATGGEPFGFEVVDVAPPMLLAEDNDLYVEVCDMLAQRRTLAASYGTDAGWLQTAGFDCLIWGPGSIEVAHKPNESLPKDELERASSLIGQLVERFCVG